METKTLGFIGGGRITKIFLQVISNNRSEYKALVVYDSNPGTLAQLKLLFPMIVIAASAREAASQDVVFIALHPPVIPETLELTGNSFKSDAMVISLAPKITIRNIASKLLHVPNIARLIPNATSYVNEGYNPVCFAETFSGIKKDALLRILRRMGHTFEVEEPKLESYAVISAMLPTYFWFQMRELVDIGCQVGLTEQESSNAVRDSMIAAIRTYFYSGLKPDEVMDLIPVKPIGDFEEQITQIYKERLITLYQKIKP